MLVGITGVCENGVVASLTGFCEGLYTGVLHKAHFFAEASSSTPQFTQYDIFFLLFLLSVTLNFYVYAHFYKGCKKFTFNIIFFKAICKAENKVVVIR